VGKPQDVPAQVKLGQRIQAMRDQVKYLPVVIIVSDATSYIEAVGSWSRSVRFPVLIDDGSPASREDIARFVRSYAPTKVARWTSPGSNGPGAFEASNTAKIFGALQRVWGVTPPGDDAALLARKWKDLGHEPPGIVVTQGNDKAWTAALPLAAAWGQPIVFLEKVPAGNIDWSLTIEEADALEMRIEQGAVATGLPFSALGDTLDAVTLCLNTAERIKKDNEFVALSDRIGRAGQGLEMKTRWAWTGHIFGSAAQSAYRAMSSLFLHPRRAWVFDGYPDSNPWNLYDGTKAKGIFEQSGLICDLDDTPAQGSKDWRARAAQPVTADLILVNSKGNNDFFDLEPGQCKPGDIPFLTRPAALHFVHSWSLLFPGKRESVGGRWFERGVFAYAGSVHEPFLQAFTPTPAVAGRLMSGAPFAPSIRVEGQPVWKIAVLGDPLYTPGPAVPRVNDPLPIDGAKAIDDGLAELLKADKWEQGVLVLKLTGRDADIAKLAATLVEAKPEALTPSVVRDCLLAAFRVGNHALVLKLYAKAPPEVAREGDILDCVWFVAYAVLAKPDATIIESPALVRLLKDALRPDQLESDAKNVAALWAKQFGPSTVDGLFSEWDMKFTTKDEAAAIARARGK
jgi:hypothetical protein